MGFLNGRITYMRFRVSGASPLPFGDEILELAEQHAIGAGWASRGDVDRWRARAQEQVEAAVITVQQEAGPDPFREDWCALSSRHLAEGRSGPS